MGSVSPHYDELQGFLRLTRVLTQLRDNLENFSRVWTPAERAVVAAILTEVIHMVRTYMDIIRNYEGTSDESESE